MSRESRVPSSAKIFLEIIIRSEIDACSASTCLIDDANLVQASKPRSRNKH